MVSPYIHNRIGRMADKPFRLGMIGVYRALKRNIRGTDGNHCGHHQLTMANYLGFVDLECRTLCVRSQLSFLKI